MYSAAPQVWRWGSRSGESPEGNPWTKGFSDTSKLPQDLKVAKAFVQADKREKAFLMREPGEGRGHLGDRLAGRETAPGAESLGSSVGHGPAWPDSVVTD